MNFLAGFAFLAFVVSSCMASRQNKSDVKITNGIDVTANDVALFPMIVDYSNQAIGVSRCSGVVVGSNTVLTAGHCPVFKPTSFVTQTDKIQVNGQVSSHFITIPREFLKPEEAAIAADPKNFTGWLQAFVPYDLAIVIIPGTFSSNLSVETSGRRSVGDKVTIYGFGGYDANDPSAGRGSLRYGHNTIKSIEFGNISIEGVVSEKGTRRTGANSATAFGDSGGPIVNKDRAVIGVTSAGQIEKNVKKSYFVDLSTVSSHFIMCLAQKYGAQIEGFWEASRCRAQFANLDCEFIPSTTDYKQSMLACY